MIKLYEGRFVGGMTFVRLKADVNGNSRWTLHWSYLRPAALNCAQALNILRRIGGKKYRGKLPGRIVFQSCCLEELAAAINRVRDEAVRGAA